MNKTININLGGTFFHIDEDAFGKLTRYLEAIKRSFKDPQGQDEIIRDIETRIAELFSEKLNSPTQVVTLKELDEVIAVMGQPEDYIIDEEIFEDTPPRKEKTSGSHKQLFRDVDNKFIAGVSSGLAHYLSIDALWIRLAWLLLTIFSSGFFVIIYIIFWILVPPALTTSEKLKMTREPINISNIERKIKEGAARIEEEVKNIDKDELKRKSTGFFDALAKVFKVLVAIVGKFIGILFIFIAITSIIGIVVGLFTGTLGVGSGNLLTTDYINAVNNTGVPFWVIGLLFAVSFGVPLFGLFILGLKLLFTNLKSIGNVAKIILATAWFASLIALGVLAVKQVNDIAYDGKVIIEETLPIKSQDTLYLNMNANKLYSHTVRRNNSFKIKLNENDTKVIYSNDIRLIVRSTNDSIAKLYIEKTAKGNTFTQAKDRAQAITYQYGFENSTLQLDGYFTTDVNHKYRNQKIEIILYLPVGTVLYADDNTYSFHRNTHVYQDILNNGDEQHYLLIEDKQTLCLDCPKKDTVEQNNTQTNNNTTNTTSTDWQIEVNKSLDETDDDGNYVKINNDGVDINITDKNDTIRVKINNQNQ